MRLSRQHPTSQRLPPGTRSPSAQNHSPDPQWSRLPGARSPSAQTLISDSQQRRPATLYRPIAEQAFWSLLTLSSDPQRSKHPGAQSSSAQTLSSDPQWSKPPGAFSPSAQIHSSDSQQRRPATLHRPIAEQASWSSCTLSPEPQPRPTAEQVWSPLTLNSDPQQSRSGAPSPSAQTHSGAGLEPARIQPGFTVEQTSWSPLTLSLD